MIHYITYKCPSCNRKIVRDINYPDYEQFVDPKNSEMTISTWCPRCGATHLYSVSINPWKNEEYRIRTHHFLCEGERVSCRLKIYEPKR